MIKKYVCEHCHNEITDLDKFCLNCGNMFINDAEPSAITGTLKAFAGMSFGEEQKNFFNWELKNAKKIKITPLEEILKEYPDIDKFLKRNKPVQKLCYMNATKLVINTHIGVEYVEGQIDIGIPIDHAWNKIKGKYFDTTFALALKGHKAPKEYVRFIELKYDEVQEFALATGHYGGYLKEKYIKGHPDTKLKSHYSGVTFKCEGCGGIIDAISQFCKHCGSELSDARTGVYKDIHINRKLKRVGQKYGGGSGKLDYTPMKGLDKKKKLVEAKFIRSLNDHLEDYEKEYTKKFGNVLGGDNAKELSPDFMKDPTELSMAVHEPSSAFIKHMYGKALSAPHAEDKDNTVIFTAGGSGAGKTSGITQFGDILDMVDKSEIVYDTMMSAFDSSDKKFNQAVNSGRTVHTVYVYRDPVEALVNGVIPRMKKTGRTMSLKVHIDNHINSFETVNKLIDKHKDSEHILFHAVDNSLGKGNAVKMDLSDIKKKSYKSKEDYLKEMKDIVDSQYKEGKLTKKEYDALNY